MAEREDAGIAPGQVDRQRQDGVGDPFAGDADEEVGDMQRTVDRQPVQRRHHRQQQHRAQQHEPQGHAPGAAGKRGGDGGAHDSAALPFSANRPLGRRWMNSMMATRTKTLASTTPAHGSSILLTTPRVSAPTSVPASEPTPPKTTTMKLSMM